MALAGHKIDQLLMKEEPKHNPWLMAVWVIVNIGIICTVIGIPFLIVFGKKWFNIPKNF